MEIQLVGAIRSYGFTMKEYGVYDSVTNSWTPPGSMTPSNIKLPLSVRLSTNSVPIEGKVYFMLRDPKGILCYNMVTREWKQLIIPVPLHLRDHAIAEFGCEIMLVGLVTENGAPSVCICELQQMTLFWKVVDRMPEILCLGFYGKGKITIDCLGSNGLLMMLSLGTSHTNPQGNDSSLTM